MSCSIEGGDVSKPKPEEVSELEIQQLHERLGNSAKHHDSVLEQVTYGSASTLNTHENLHAVQLLSVQLSMRATDIQGDGADLPSGSTTPRHELQNATTMGVEITAL